MKKIGICDRMILLIHYINNYINILLERLTGNSKTRTVIIIC